ncbi:(2Fe-2S)-binding protein [Marinobacter sp. LV10R520-4]
MYVCLCHGVTAREILRDYNAQDYMALAGMLAHPA